MFVNRLDQSMIVGITHDENRELIKVIQFGGKVSIGLGANTGLNKADHPMQTGVFRMFKEKQTTRTIDGKVYVMPQWILDQKAQTNLEMMLSINGKPNTMPRVLPFLCLDYSPSTIWDSYMAAYTSQGLFCKSNGRGTVAKRLTTSSGNRKYVDIECKLEECEFYKDGKTCKPSGRLCLYPLCDVIPGRPYKYETRSPTTIKSIENGLYEMWSLLCLSHEIRCLKENNYNLVFGGFKFSEFILKSRKVMKGGRDVFIVELFPTKEFAERVKAPILQMVEMIKTNPGFIPSLDRRIENIDMSPGAKLETKIINASPDGMTPEEQALYIQEFSPEEKAEMSDVPDDDIDDDNIEEDIIGEGAVISSEAIKGSEELLK